MNVENFISVLETLGSNYYTGVPDSLLSPFCDYLIQKHGISDHHVIAANEGAAVGLAAGHYLATGQPSVVYMQNSGIGNAINPICSLLNEKVYAIPTIFVIGWRGEPGVNDEPQHVFQGEITLKLLDCLQIPYVIISKDSEVANLKVVLSEFKNHLSKGRSVAFVIKKGALSGSKAIYSSNFTMTREKIIQSVISKADEDDVFVCTTGKLSREMFELREQLGKGHNHDFLTVGSMGHSIMIAMGIATTKPNKTVYCLDGDGATLMHMGSLGVVGVHHPKNLVHVVINNGAHESVGGFPAVSSDLDLSSIARSLKYANVYKAVTEQELNSALNKIKHENGPIFIEAVSNLKSREDLGRPTTTTYENKKAFMDYLKEV